MILLQNMVDLYYPTGSACNYNSQDSIFEKIVIAAKHNQPGYFVVIAAPYPLPFSFLF